MYQSTSYEAYKSLEKLNEKQLTVLNAIRTLGECNDRMIQEHLRWPINRITPRRGELIELGRIVDTGKKKDPVTNRTTLYWKAVQKEYQMELFT